MELNKVHIFRMTHIGNIAHVVKHGITHSNSPNSNIDYYPIGDTSLITTRHRRTLFNGKILGDYTPFYFWYRMPMLYVIQNGFNGVSRIDPENIIYCVSNVRIVIEHHLPFMFTDGHAIDGFSEFFSDESIKDIERIVDFKAVKEPYWRRDDDLDLKRRKEAEFLIEGDIPFDIITHYIAYNDNAAAILAESGIDTQKIIVNPKYYF